MDKKKSDLVNFAKGFSIVAIVLFHLVAFYMEVPEIIKTASYFGGAGVHIFIICSGYGLALSYFYKPLTYIEFLRRRMSKIYIPYIAVILVCFLFYDYENRVLSFLSHVFLFKMFVPELEESFGAQFWYISTLFQLYFVFVPLMKIEKKLGDRKFFVLSSIVSMVWIAFTILCNITEIRIWNSFFLQFLWEFCLGICLAKKFRKDGLEIATNTKKSYILIGTIFAGLLFAVLALKGGIFKSVNDVFSVCAFGGITILLFKLQFLNKIFLKINSFSYELYLLHILAFDVVFLLLGEKLPNIIVCVIALIFAFGVSITYHLLIGLVHKIRCRYIFVSK